MSNLLEIDSSVGWVSIKLVGLTAGTEFTNITFSYDVAAGRGTHGLVVEGLYRNTKGDCCILLHPVALFLFSAGHCSVLVTRPRPLHAGSISCRGSLAPLHGYSCHERNTIEYLSLIIKHTPLPLHNHTLQQLPFPLYTPQLPSSGSRRMYVGTTAVPSFDVTPCAVIQGTPAPTLSARRIYLHRPLLSSAVCCWMSIGRKTQRLPAAALPKLQSDGAATSRTCLQHRGYSPE